MSGPPSCRMRRKRIFYRRGHHPVPRMSHRRRTVFFVSDGTGISAETLGHSLLTQFEDIEFTQTVLPFVDSVAKAHESVARIEEARLRSGVRPIVFCTLVNDEVRNALRAADALVLDFFQGFLNPLEAGVLATPAPPPPARPPGSEKQQK